MSHVVTVHNLCSEVLLNNTSLLLASGHWKPLTSEENPFCQVEEPPQPKLRRKMLHLQDAELIIVGCTLGLSGAVRSVSPTTEVSRLARGLRACRRRLRLASAFVGRSQWSGTDRDHAASTASTTHENPRFYRKDMVLIGGPSN